MVDRATFVGQVRDYLRDHPQFNALQLNDFETSDAVVSLCADLAADDITNSPPLIGTFSVENCPMYILFIGTVLQVLRSAGLMQARNNLNYSDGGLTIATSDKSPIYKAWADTYSAEYEAKKLSYKKARNAQSAYGGVASEYTFIGAFGQYMGLASMDSFTSIRYGFMVF